METYRFQGMVGDQARRDETRECGDATAAYLKAVEFLLAAKNADCDAVEIWRNGKRFGLVRRDDLQAG
jgi:hypothetical protein